MQQEILINAGAAEIRIAAVEDGKLQALVCEPACGADRSLRRGHSRIGDIVLGRVTRIVPAMQAAFVEIGMERAGFLGVREARSLAAPEALGAREPSINELVREGDAVLVQIVKDPIGEKGARLSAAVTLPGRLCVLAPFQPGIALSRRIEDAAERERLTALGAAMLEKGGAGLMPQAGFIVRTNACGVGLDELLDDALALCGVWHDVEAARRSARPPVLLHHDLGPVARALRDLARADTRRILIDDATALETARLYCRQAMPEMASRIEAFSGPGALFDMYDIETDIEGLARPRVALSCGGWITVEGTEALTAVDVNSGSFTHAAGIDEMGLEVNLAAARELGRQIRLRGIGGVIVVDFIHMSGEDHIARVIAELERSLARDGKPVAVAPASPFGLVEVTRKRVGEPHDRQAGEPCACCRGSGRVRRASAVALDIVRRMESAARAAPGMLIRVEAAPEVIGWIAAQGEDLRVALIAKGAARFDFLAKDSLSREEFHVETQS
jgi:ribonuclease G